MANDLVGLINKVVDARPQPVADKPRGTPTMSASGRSTVGWARNASSERLKFFPGVDPELLEDSYSTDDPMRPGGALECISVTQIAGADPHASGPVQVRTYQVRGKVVS
jgi:hypothetical protein